MSFATAIQKINEPLFSSTLYILALTKASKKFDILYLLERTTQVKMSETPKHIPLINVDEQGEILIDYRCGYTITKHFIFIILQKQQSIMSLALYVSLNKAFSTTDLANLTLCQDLFCQKAHNTECTQLRKKLRSLQGHCQA